MICVISKADDRSESCETSYPIFVQYVIPEKIVEESKDTWNPHGNAKKSARSFTSSPPTVLSEIRVNTRWFSFNCCIFIDFVVA